MTKPTPRPVLDLEGIRVVRNGVEILGGVDFTMLPGEHWALLGPNGSGKTTLLNVLLTYVSPTSGTIRVLGETHGKSDWRLLRRKVGIVSTSVEREIPGDDSALDVVYSGALAMLGSWGAKDDARLSRARALLDQVGCGEVEGRAFRLLSQGERQRALIGRALMADPELLVLDEPCAGLDPVARQGFLELLEQLMQDPSPSILLVTHQIEEIPKPTTHALLLSAGKVLARGPKSQVLTESNLSNLYGVPVALQEASGRLRLSLKRHRTSFSR